jgi:hypothetical protein
LISLFVLAPDVAVPVPVAGLADEDDEDAAP